MRDAEEAPFIPTRYPRIPPRAGNSRVWLRLGGGWRPGIVMQQVPVDGRWVLWCSYDRPVGAPGCATPAYIRVWHDPEAVRPRRDDEPPED